VLKLLRTIERFRGMELPIGSRSTSPGQGSGEAPEVKNVLKKNKKDL